MNNTVPVCLHGTNWVSLANRVAVFHDKLKLILEILLTVKPQHGTDSLILSVRGKAACALSKSVSCVTNSAEKTRASQDGYSDIHDVTCFMESEFFLTVLQGPETGSIPEPSESSQCPHTL
jgi:hypothetical protein